MRTELFGSNEDRVASANLAIVVTDGVSTVQKDNTIPEANAAKNADIQIYVVGVTTAIDEAELRSMSSPPQVEGQNYFKSPTFLELEKVLVQVLRQTCGGPPITQPQPPPSLQSTSVARVSVSAPSKTTTSLLHNLSYCFVVMPSFICWSSSSYY